MQQSGNSCGVVVTVHSYAIHSPLTVLLRRTTLSNQQKTAYFNAELCLYAAPARTSIPGVVSRYDDLVWLFSLHIQA